MVRNSHDNGLHSFLAAAGEANLLEAGIAKLKQLFSAQERARARQYKELKSMLDQELGNPRQTVRVPVRSLRRTVVLAVLLALFAALLAMNSTMILTEFQSGNYFGLGSGGAHSDGSSCGTN